MNSKNLFIRAALFASPLWLLLTVDAYSIHLGGNWLAVFHIPGVALMLLFNPTWEQMHNYAPWQYLIGDFVFYYLGVLLILYLRKRVRFQV